MISINFVNKQNKASNTKHYREGRLTSKPTSWCCNNIVTYVLIIDCATNDNDNDNEYQCVSLFNNTGTILLFESHVSIFVKLPKETVYEDHYR